MSLSMITIGYRFQYPLFIGKVIAYAGFIENYPVSYFEIPPVSIDGSPVLSMIRFSEGAKYIDYYEANCLLLLDFNFNTVAEKFLTENGTIISDGTGFKSVRELTGKKRSLFHETLTDSDKKIKRHFLEFNSLSDGGNSHLKRASYFLGAFAALNGYVERENLITSMEKNLPEKNELYFDSFWKGYEKFKGKID